MISSTRSMDTYMSLLTCSERMILPFTGIVTSIFCLSFSTLKVTCASVSAVKYFSSLPILSSTAALKPSVTSIFFPTIINFISLIPSIGLLYSHYSIFVVLIATIHWTCFIFFDTGKVKPFSAFFDRFCFFITTSQNIRSFSYHNFCLSTSDKFCGYRG